MKNSGCRCSALDEAKTAFQKHKSLAAQVKNIERQLATCVETVDTNLTELRIANNMVFTKQATEVVRKICCDHTIQEYMTLVAEKEKVEQSYVFAENSPDYKAVISVARQHINKELVEREFRMDEPIGFQSVPDITQHLAIVILYRKKEIDWKNIEVSFYEHRYVSNRNETKWDKHDRTAIFDQGLNYTLLCLQSTYTALQVIVKAFDPEFIR